MPAHTVCSILIIPLLVGCSSPSEVLGHTPVACAEGACEVGLVASGKTAALTGFPEEAPAAVLAVAALAAERGAGGVAAAHIGESLDGSPDVAAVEVEGAADYTDTAWGEAVLTLCSFLGVLAVGLWLERRRPKSAFAARAFDGEVAAAKHAARKAAAGGELPPVAAAPPRAKVPPRSCGDARAVARGGSGSSSSGGRGAVGAAGVRARGTGAGEERRGSVEGADALAAAVRGGQAGDLPRLLDEARALIPREGLAAADVVAVETQQLLSALRACAAQRRFREALAAYDHVARRLGEGCGGVWSLLLYSAVAAGEFQRCEAFFERLCRFSDPSGHDFLNMVHFYAHRRDLVGLRRMLDDMEERGVQVNGLSWNRALAACAAAGAPSLAEALVASGTREGAMDAVAYNTLMRSYVRSGNTDRCFKCYEEMQAKGVSPSEVTFGVLLEACHEASDFARAKEVFEGLRRSGIRPNVVHCTALMKCLTGEGRLEDAEQVLRWMLRSPDSPPDLLTYSMLVKARAEHGDVRGALRILQEMLGRGIQPDAVVLNSVLSGCCVAGVAPLELHRVLQWLVDRGLQPSAITLSILVKALGSRQAWDEALLLLSEAPEKFGVWPEARIYAQLAQACAKAGEGGKAVQTYAAMVQAAARQGVRVGRPANSRLLAVCTSCDNVAAAAAKHINRIVVEAAYFVGPDCVATLAGLVP